MCCKELIWVFLLNVSSLSAVAQSDLTSYDYISSAQDVSSITVLSSYGDIASFHGTPADKLHRIKRSAAFEVKIRGFQATIDIVTAVGYSPSVQCAPSSDGYADAIIDIRYRNGKKKKEYWYVEGQIFDPKKRICFSSPKIIEKILNL